MKWSFHNAKWHYHSDSWKKVNANDSTATAWLSCFFFATKDWTDSWIIKQSSLLWTWRHERREWTRKWRRRRERDVQVVQPERVGGKVLPHPFLSLMCPLRAAAACVRQKARGRKKSRKRKHAHKKWSINLPVTGKREYERKDGNGANEFHPHPMIMRQPVAVSLIVTVIAVDATHHAHFWCICFLYHDFDLQIASHLPLFSLSFSSLLHDSVSTHVPWYNFYFTHLSPSRPAARRREWIWTREIPTKTQRREWQEFLDTITHGERATAGTKQLLNFLDSYYTPVQLWDSTCSFH